MVFSIFYAPFLKDLAKSCSTFKFKKFELNNPTTPYLQLLSVLPPQSSNLLPKPLDTLITTNSEISKYYPREFEIDLSGNVENGKVLLLFQLLILNWLKKSIMKMLIRFHKIVKNLIEWVIVIFINSMKIINIYLLHFTEILTNVKLM